jgi:hypothetical protein
MGSGVEPRQVDFFLKETPAKLTRKKKVFGTEASLNVVHSDASGHFYIYSVRDICGKRINFKIIKCSKLKYD